VLRFDGQPVVFLRREAASGAALLVAAVAAFILSNSHLAWTYDALLHTPVSVRVGAFAIDKPLLLGLSDISACETDLAG
jgi:NhaA family Na+:H+ antiporter